MKAGDVVFVVPQKKRYGADPLPYTTQVVRVGNRYGYIKQFERGEEKPFLLTTGQSHHKESNMRANGYGFDVYATEQEYWEKELAEKEHQRLYKRLVFYSRLVDLPADAVTRIHSVLDEYNVKEQ